MKFLRNYKLQLLVILTVCFLFVTLVLLGVLEYFTHISTLGIAMIVALPLLATLKFAFLTFLILFFWKKYPSLINHTDYLLDALREGVIVIDQKGRVTKINKQATAYLSVTDQNVVGHAFDSFAPASYTQLVQEAFMLKKPILAAIKGRKQGNILDVTAIGSEKQKFVILLIQDQTNVHKAVELARDFIANASHELKTPIAIVSGFAETLHDHPELSEEVTREITGRIVDNCERMVSLVKNLITLAAIDEGIPEDRLHRCDPKTIVESARATILELHPQAEIKITQKTPFIMKADKDLLQQAILNLLDNAVKYSGEKPRIEVELTQSKEETVIAVRDFGPGIAQENLERIFERFFAIDKTLSRSLGGYGLGLSIVQRIVEKHYGQIDVISQPGEGTTFTLRFPRLKGV